LFVNPIPLSQAEYCDAGMYIVQISDIASNHTSQYDSMIEWLLQHVQLSDQTALTIPLTVSQELCLITLLVFCMYEIILYCLHSVTWL